MCRGDIFTICSIARSPSESTADSYRRRNLETLLEQRSIPDEASTEDEGDLLAELASIPRGVAYAMMISDLQKSAARLKAAKDPFEEAGWNASSCP